MTKYIMLLHVCISSCVIPEKTRTRPGALNTCEVCVFKSYFETCIFLDS